MHPLTSRKIYLLAALMVLWALYGLTGRDAWKGEEALALGQVLDWLDHSHAHASIVPLHTFLAGLSAQLLSPWLDIQDAARAVSGLFTLIALACTGLAARALFGPGFGPAAALLLMGAFGLMLRAHALLPDSLQLAAYALLLYGAALARSQVRPAALAIAVALLALTLIDGLSDLVLGLLILSLPLASRDWRERPYRQAIVRGIGLGLLLVGLWFAWLASQGSLSAWLAGHGLAGLLPVYDPGHLLSLLAWSAWPVWPLAIWAVWHEHKRLGRASQLHLALLAVIVLFYAALTPAFSRDGGALPLLVPLSLLAAFAVGHMQRSAAQAFYWFGVLCFIFLIIVFWVHFAALEWGWPPRLADRLARMTPDYQSGAVGGFGLGLAVIATVVWLIAIPFFPRAQLRPALVWATGMTLTWLLLMALFRPWGEAGWAWRPVLAELDRQLPAGACIQSQVEADTAVMLRYHLGSRLAQPGQTCDYLLIQGRRGEAASPGPGYEYLWLGQRPRYKDQALRLFRHVEPS
ncbi:MAG: hypothetical protein HXY26_00345 [Hydrogenophilaceae bacterium]|nr:hypothetical protein [Hydrogenophilaceae bacterium]